MQTRCFRFIALAVIPCLTVDPGFAIGMTLHERVAPYVTFEFKERVMALPTLSSTSMERYLKPFGHSGKNFYVLGLGLMWTGRSRPYLAGQEADFVHPGDEEMEAYLDYAFSNLGNRLGQVLLDTAAAYGPSEERLGRILRAHPLWFERAFIATKGGEEWDPKTGQSTLKQSAKDLVASFERSLARLGKVNLFYIHQASLKVLQDRHPIAALRQLMQARRGGLEHLGLSISRPEVLENVVSAARADPSLFEGIDAVQLPTRVFLDSPDAIRFLHERGIALVLNRPHLAAPAADEQAYYRELATRPEVSVILGGGRRHLPRTATYFADSPIFKFCAKLREAFPTQSALLNTLARIEAATRALTHDEIAFLMFYPDTARFFAGMADPKLHPVFKKMKAESVLKFMGPTLAKFHGARRIPGTSILVLQEFDRLDVPEEAIAKLKETMELLQKISKSAYRLVTEEIKVIYLDNELGTTILGEASGHGVMSLNPTFQRMTDIVTTLIEEADHHRFMREFPDEALVSADYDVWRFPKEQAVYGGVAMAKPAIYLCEAHAALTLMEVFGPLLVSAIVNQKGNIQQVVKKEITIESKKLHTLLGVLGTLRGQSILTPRGEALLNELEERVGPFAWLVPPTKDLSNKLFAAYESLTPAIRQTIIDPIHPDAYVRETLASFRLGHINRSDAFRDLTALGFEDEGLIDAWLTQASAPVAMDERISRTSANRLRLFKALRASDFHTAQHLVEAAYFNSPVKLGLTLKMARLDDPGQLSAWMNSPARQDISGIDHEEVSVPDRVPSMKPLEIDSLFSAPQKIGVGDLLVFAHKRGKVLKSHFYQVKEAHYRPSPSDLDEPSYTFVLENLLTGDSLTLRENDWYKHGGNPAYELMNFYWLGSADDMGSDAPLLNVHLYGDLSSKPGLNARKNLGLAFVEGETIASVIGRCKSLNAYLFHKPAVLLPQVHLYLNGKSIAPTYRLKAKDRMATVQVLDYFGNCHHDHERHPPSLRSST